MTITAYALACFALIAITLIATNPGWKKWGRRRRIVEARHARVAEDRAWQLRDGDVMLARALHFARYDREQILGTGSLRVLDYEPDEPATPGWRLTSGWRTDG